MNVRLESCLERGYVVSEEGLEVVDRKDASASFLSRAGYVDGNGVIGGAGVVLYAYIRLL